jgi:hypothetical protein
MWLPALLLPDSLEDHNGKATGSVIAMNHGLFCSFQLLFYSSTLVVNDSSYYGHSSAAAPLCFNGRVVVY